MFRDHQGARSIELWGGPHDGYSTVVPSPLPPYWRMPVPAATERLMTADNLTELPEFKIDVYQATDVLTGSGAFRYVWQSTYKRTA